ncbi:NfeD family protein [Desulfofalx alkaliphila]|uniref:NfeD family protein n=1 Tax=Desulfofalx alkaliphila TaxID=105483 RepID=UPI000A6E63A1|nr:NfeD family protein [Desulfofalx alkaliphila]
MPELFVWLAVLALILGVLSLLVEILVFPGFGVAGMTGVLLLVWGVVLLSTDIVQSVQSLVIGLLITIALIMWIIRFGHKRKFWHKLALGDRQDQSYSSARQGLKDLLGKEGKALTKLRPAGAAEIDGQRIDVVTEGSFVEQGTPLVVTKVEGMRVIVRPVRPPAE